MFKTTLARAIQLAPPDMVPMVKKASEAFKPNTSGLHRHAFIELVDKVMKR